MDEHELRVDLSSLSAWLCHLLELETIDTFISSLKPITATYKWQGLSRDERFLLSIKIASKEIKILNLWIPASKRKQAIGSAILDRLSTLSRSWGIKSIQIEPRPGSEGFWSKTGFIPSELYVGSPWRFEQPDHPTSYPEINAVLDELLHGAQAILSDQFIGLYLYGSLASGDFNPQTSDIDFIVVTTSEIPEEVIPELEALHTHLWASGSQTSGSKWAAKLEGAYLPQESLHRYNPDAPPRPAVNEGKFYMDRQDSAWIIQRHILREHGVAVAGPPLRDWIDPVSSEDLMRAVAGILREWWAPMLQNPARLQTPEYQAYAVLTMCRALYTLEHGMIVSKPAAARWAQTALEQRWRGLVERAIAWRPGVDFEALGETLDFIRFTINRFQVEKMI